MSCSWSQGELDQQDRHDQLAHQPLHARGHQLRQNRAHCGAHAFGVPIDQKLWFAGEALSLSAHSQLHGAWLSGQSAAYGTLSSLGAAVRAPA